MIQIDPTVALAAFRTGRLKAGVLGTGIIENWAVRMNKEIGFVYHPTITAWWSARLNNRPPFNDPRVREALDLAIDRKALQTIAVQGGASRTRLRCCRLSWAVSGGSRRR